MSVESFIDTNVFIYQLEGTDERRAGLAADLIERGIADGTACISFQVVQECVNVALRKARKKLNTQEMKRYLDAVLDPLLLVHSSMRLYRSSLRIQSRYRFSFYDALIVAAALEADCRQLYSEDMQDGQRIQQLTIINPFRVQRFVRKP